MDRLVLVRHGVAGSNRDGIASCVVPGEGLTPEGVEQARVLREHLVGTAISLGVTTELARTRETLAAALDGREIPVLVVPDLNEIHFGSFDAGPLETYRAWAAERSPTERAPGGESRTDAAGRFARGLRVLLARDEETIVLFGHALMIRYAIDAAVGLVPAARMAPVEHAHPYPLGRSDVEGAVELLESWAQAPASAFRT